MKAPQPARVGEFFVVLLICIIVLRLTRSVSAAGPQPSREETWSVIVLPLGTARYRSVCDGCQVVDGRAAAKS